jgi:hypothetical protein
MSTIQFGEHVTIEEIENAVAIKDHLTALKKIHAMMKLLDVGLQFDNVKTQRENQINLLSMQAFTRLAAAMANLLIDPTFEVASNNVPLFASMHRSIHTLFATSGFFDTDYLIKILNKQLEEGDQTKIKNSVPQCVLKILILYSLQSAIQLDYQYFFKNFHLSAAFFYFGMLSFRLVISENATKKRQELLQMAEHIGSFNASTDLVYCALPAWTNCTNAQGDNKNSIKQHINHLICRWLSLQKVAINAPLSLTKSKKKPILAIVIERYETEHESSQIFAQNCRALSESFSLMGFVLKGHLDNQCKALFESTFEIADDISRVEEFTRRILSVKPQVLYYPSLGLANLSVILSNIRLAPIQILGIEHPASSQSQQIDYCLLEECSYRAGLEKMFTERLALTPTTFKSALATTRATTQLVKQEASKIVKIAIATASDHLSDNFIKVLSQIQKRSHKPVELHFFSNEMGLRYEHCKIEIMRLFGFASNVIVYPQVSRDEYETKLMNQCHLVASSFPFCSTTSTASALQMGLPVVAMDQAITIEATHDANFIRWLQLPNWLIGKSEEEYIAAVLRLIDNESERAAIGQQCSQAIMQQRQSLDKQTEPNYVAKMFYYLFEQHEKIKNNKEVIRYHDLEKEVLAAETR